MIAALVLAGCTNDGGPRGHRPRRVPDDPPVVAAPPECQIATFLPLDGEREDLTDRFTFGAEVILDRPGTLTLCDVTWPAGLVVAADLRVVGAGADRTTLDGGGVRPVIRVEDGASLTLESLTVVGGEGIDGGGASVLGAGELTLRDVTFRANHARHQGGGLYVEGARVVVLDEVRFEDDDADSAGGGAFVRSATSLTVTGGSFVGNRAVGDGGGLRVHATPTTLVGTVFEGNRSEDRGGALSVDTGADVVGADLVISGNSAAARGGGVWIDDLASLTLDRGSLSGNTATDGGAIALQDQARLTLVGGELVGNGAVGNGGGVLAANGATLELTDVDVRENDAGDDGAGMFLSDVVAIVTRGTLTGNVAVFDGGAVATSGPAAVVRLSEVRIEANSARRGGALFVGAGTVDCVGAAIVRNVANAGGAAAVFEGTLGSVGCDLGEGVADNVPADIRLILDRSDASYGAGATFTCDLASCR